MAYDVFISHSSADKQFADIVCEFLESKGIGCWIAPRDILPGDEWGDSILKGINASPIMVLIFSKSANDSGPVRSEVDRAVNARKVLIPFRIENTQPTGAMEFHIGRRHWLDAYKPPMEKHLELLARAVGDVLKPPVPATEGTPRTDATLTPTPTPTQTGSLRFASLQTPVVEHDDVPLRLLFNFNHVVVVGYPSTFEVIVENKNTISLEQIEIVMESRGLEEPVRKTVPRLMPGMAQRHLLEIEPIRSGNFALQCTIKCQEEMKQLAFVGSRSLRINETPGTSNVVINIKDLKDNSGTATAGDAQLSALVAPGTVRTLNDLLNLELPEDFQPLELSLDYEVSMRALANEEASAHHRLQIPGAFLAQSQDGTLLKLEPVAPAPNSTAREIRLVARPVFTLGRSREEADFLTWFWPRSEVNDQKTRRISKKHCIFAVHGSKVFARDNETSNRTTLDGQALVSADGEPLEKRSILKLADTYVLDVTPFASAMPEGPSILNLRSWCGAQTATAPMVGGSVRFIPMGAHVMPQNSTWLLTDGTFGTSRTNPIIIEGKGLAEIQGRFYHYLGGFWIESSVKNGGVVINNIKLEPGFIVPLLSGQVVKLGENTFRVTLA